MQTNTLANVSIGSAIGVIVLYMISMCIGMIPLVGLLALLLYPIEWILAFVAVVTGILGFRTAAMMDGAGKGQAVAGAAIGGVWLLFQIVVWMMLFFFGGMAILLDNL